MNRLIIFTLTFLTFSSCFQNNNNPLSGQGSTSNQVLTSSSLKTDSSGLSKTTALLKTVHGNLQIKFYPKKAPNTVTRILELIQQGFYDGLQFHRVISKFVVQTGDPTALGTGGSGSKLKAEFNDLQHVKGTLAMARSKDDKDSADSQFYIALNTLPHLDGNYTVFGQVTEGLDHLDKIQKGDKILSFSLNN